MRLQIYSLECMSATAPMSQDTSESIQPHSVYVEYDNVTYNVLSSARATESL